MCHIHLPYTERFKDTSKLVLVNKTFRHVLFVNDVINNHVPGGEQSNSGSITIAYQTAILDSYL